MAERVYSSSTNPPTKAGELEEDDVEARARRWLAEQPVPVYPALWQALGFLGIFLVGSVMGFTGHKEEFKGNLSGKPVPETHVIVDGIYFTISMFCRVGYGDFAPQSPLMKTFCSVYALVGVGFFQILLYRALGLLLKDVEKKIFRTDSRWYHLARNVMDERNGGLSEKARISFALATMALCIGIGSLLICTLEGREVGSSIYMSIISVTTVGFGDITFTTFYGRLYGSLWLLVSTMVVMRCFFTMVEARIRLEEQKVLQEVIAHFAKLDTLSISTNGKALTGGAPRSQGHLVRRNI